ncbi:MAG: HAD family hydrolase [Gemmatimonadaceae bacterium]
MTRPLPEGLSPGGRFAEWAPGVPAYVVADVDGTLLAGGTTATPGVAGAVADAHAAGLRVGFATGRLPVGVRGLQRQLVPEGPHVLHNGAQIWVDGRPLRTWPLDATVARRLRDAYVEHGLYAEFFVGEEFFVTDYREAARPTWEHISGEPAGLIADLDLDAIEIVKATVVAFGPDELPVALEQTRRFGLDAEAAPSPLLPDAGFINVTSPETDKGRALTHAAAHLGIGLDQVVAVGDGRNDLTMLAVAGTAVAMGQAPPELRDAAHLVVPEVDEDGVAHALRAAARWRAEARGGA